MTRSVVLQVAAVYVPLLQNVLRTVPPTLTDWAVIAVCSLMRVVVVEIVKLFQSILKKGRAAMLTPDGGK